MGRGFTVVRLIPCDFVDIYMVHAYDMRLLLTASAPPSPPSDRLQLQEITERLKVNLAKIKKITQAEGRVKGDWRAGKASAKDGKGGAEGEAWRDAGGILDDMKEGINVNLKDVKVPEFDVRLWG